MRIGYARVSTDDQDLTRQRTALQVAECERIFEEKVSGAVRARPQLEEMLGQLRTGDVVTVTRLDRLARPPAIFSISRSASRPRAPACGP